MKTYDELADENLAALGEMIATSEPIGPQCRGCGCSQFEPCETENGNCFWVDDDLCSACFFGTAVQR